MKNIDINIVVIPISESACPLGFPESTIGLNKEDETEKAADIRLACPNAEALTSVYLVFAEHDNQKSVRIQVEAKARKDSFVATYQYDQTGIASRSDKIQKVLGFEHDDFSDIVMKASESVYSSCGLNISHSSNNNADYIAHYYFMESIQNRLNM